MLWLTELKFCVWFCFTVLQIKLECSQFALIFVGVMPLSEWRILKIVFRTFLLHALTYWAEILHFTLFYSTTDQVRVLSISVNFWELCPFWNLEYWKYTVFPHFFSYMLWHIELKFCIWLCFTILQSKFQCRQFPSIFDGVIPLLELRILKRHSFTHFYLTRFDLLSWNFAFHFVLLYYRLSLSVLNLR